MKISNKAKSTLLSLAKNTIAKSLDLPYEKIDASKYDKKLGAFVTLKINNNLRGCIGYIIGIKPLYKEIENLALDAAYRDYRFAPLTKDEFKDLEIEISILSEPKIINNLNEFELNRDGIIFTLGNYRSVFLPQVATETGWDKEQLLSALSQKAGLSPLSYKDENAQFMTFMAEVF